MAKPSIKPFKFYVKQKRGYLTGSTKQAKKCDIGGWDFTFPVLVRLESFLTNFVSFRRGIHSASFSNSASSLSMRSTPSLSSLFISGILPPIFRFSSSVSYWVRKFFIRLILRFSSSISHWVKRFFIYYALSTKLKKFYPCMPTRLAELAF